MSKEKETIKELKKEVLQLRQRIKDLEALEAEHEHVEKALKDYEEKYSNLIETSPDSITLTDIKSGKIVMANQVALEMRGYSNKKEFIGKKTYDLIAPHDIEKAEKDMKEALETGSVKNLEYTLLKKDGTTFLTDVSVSVIKDTEGNPKFFMAVVRDVTERKKMQEALAAEKERLDVTLRSISDGVITVNTEGRIVLVNVIAERLTGWKQEEAIGLPIDEVLHVVDKKTNMRCENLFRNVIKTGNVIDIFGEEILVSKNGTERIISESCAPIRDRGGIIVGVVLIIRDITEKEKLENELFRARKLESIGVMAGGIAHDFNNILTAITSNMFLSKIDLKKDDKAYNYIEEAEKAAFRATKLTNQLLTFAKGGTPIKENQSICEVIEESVGFSLSGSNVDCRLELPDNLWELEIDRGQIDQVINNLVINADQAMPDGGTIVIKGGNVTISDDIPEGTNASLPLEPGKYVRISIKDTGIGIRPDDLEKIYDPYFTIKQRGNGLGLTVCYSILKKHNGLITAKSKLGVGTTFYIYLPASKSKVKSKKDEGKELLKGVGKILVMDDEEIVKVATGHVLKSLEYDVEFARDGSEAIEKYKKAMESGQPFDALIMDLTIPGGMGGKDAIKKLVEIDPDVKAIVSSGYSNDPIMANFSKYGFSGIVTKPYMVEELNRVLHNVIIGSK